MLEVGGGDEESIVLEIGCWGDDELVGVALADGACVSSGSVIAAWAVA